MAMRDHMNPSVHLLKRSRIREFTKLANEVPGCIRLTLGEPDFRTPEIITEAAVSALREGATHYIANSGAAHLREAVSDHERTHNGMDHSAEEVIITAGATEALFTALTGIIEPGDEVIIPRPAFVLYEEIVHLCGGRVAALDTSEDDFQIRKERLSPLITERTKAIILNSPNNPTGCVYDLRSLETVRDAVSRNDMFAVCDDVYRQLCYSDDLKSFASYSNESKDLREKIIVVQSFSKPYAMTGWRMGYLMADRSVAERLELIHQFNIVSTPAPFQDACAAALSYDPAEMIETYKERRDYVCSRLDSMGLGCGRPDGAFYVFPSVRKFGITSEEFCRRLITEAGTAVTPGSAFGSDDHIRISYCCSMADLKEGLSRLESFVKKLNGYS